MGRTAGKHRFPKPLGPPFSRARRNWKASVRSGRDAARNHLLAYPAGAVRGKPVSATGQISASSGSTSPGSGGQLGPAGTGYTAGRIWAAHTECYPIFGAAATSARAWARLASCAAWSGAGGTVPGGPTDPRVAVVTAAARPACSSIFDHAGGVHPGWAGVAGRPVRPASGVAQLSPEDSARVCRAAADSLYQAAYSSRTSPALPGGRVGVGLMVPPEMANGNGNQLR